MIARQGSLGLLYTWTIILLGFGWLWKIFPQLNLDQGGTLAILIVLGILAEWMAVPFPQGYLSGGYVIVAATQLICGGAATAWVTGLVSLIGLGIANRGNPLRTTLFNSSQHVLAAAAAAFVFEQAEGEILPILLFTLVYFAVNHILVYFYLLPGRRDHPDLFGWDALRWDGYTYLFTAPYGSLMAALYLKMGVSWALVLFLPVLAAQLIFRKYVHMELSNRELTALFQVARRLRVSNEPDTFFNQILQESRRIVPFHTAVIFFWSQERQLFLPGAAQGPWQDEMCNVAVAPGEGLVGQVVESKEPVVIDDVRAMDSPADAGPFRRFRSVLVVPLLARGEVTGVLALGNMHPCAYEEKHVQMISIIGGQAGIVLANDMLVEKIRHLSVTDRLTEFLNHRQFYHRAVKEMMRSQAAGEPASLLLVNIDNMRVFNSRYGHGAGDAVIQMVAAVLRDVTRPADLLGRYGGGELAVLAPGCDTAAALKLAEQIRVEVRDCRLVPEESKQQVRVTVSVGVATFPQDTADPDQLFFGAEKAVARAKELGRDRSIAYSQLVKEIKLKVQKDVTSAVP
ncbi:sensor domain-containing diguanylate cyclase [Desulforamulus putei]|uniref:Diguanylate cyclase with GAF sensor n=1 Tax=Desulforamulus putei DSM 12395 TaxID=1121429 RepID=A0A1M4VCG4_9FIRM|nr:sensor domain-containing diguanylate cyclase [Desulforamulus putei]SHE66641.1 diguanylate cyclase with GAF sensor [Desulforamulus putei DSM 12395]